ncbi:MAG: hypothetical protein FWD89_05275 [Firmicutes bacterium]|nr:hypothetical protein [Bacillota bacterium]
MTTLEVFLAIMGIILIVLAAAVVLVIMIRAIIRVLDRNRSVSKQQGSHIGGELYYKDDAKSTSFPVREVYYKEKETVTNNNDIIHQLAKAESDSLAYNREVALQEQEELAKLKLEEAQVRGGKFARSSEPSKEELMADVLQPYGLIESKPEEEEDDFDSFFKFDSSKKEEDDEDEYYFDFLEGDKTKNNITNTYNFAAAETGADADKLKKLEEEIESLKKELKQERDKEEKERIKTRLMKQNS